jgi:hypothetical protein
VLLNSGLTRQEVLSDQAQTGVADVADIDRSAELLTWIWNSIFSPIKVRKPYFQLHHLHHILCLKPFLRILVKP